jgi:hypothetical protein
MQFSTIFQMLKQGLLMGDYDKVKESNDFLKVLSNACKQWTNNIGWKMATKIHDYVLICI